MRGREVDPRSLLLAVCLALLPPMAHADTISLYAAGSLRGALTDIARNYEAATGDTVQMTFGASGRLKDEIAGGAKASVFASANMAHPRALHEAGKSGPVVLFARNRLCALTNPLLKVTTGNLLTRMLDPEVKLATSTPKADPSGDYAFEVFAKADKIMPGAQAMLEKKAKQLTGSSGSAAPPAGRNVYGWHVAERHADIFLTYCTNAIVAQKENPGLQSIALPDNLAVGADYGLTVIKGAQAAAQRFANFIVSPDGETILTAYGFSLGTAP